MTKSRGAGLGSTYNGVVMLTLLVSYLGFNAMVVVHELGHLLAARAFGVKVCEFCVGSGPVLWRARFGDTSCMLRILPLGGFVRFAGVGDDEPADALRGQAAWRRALILLAGPFVNVAATVLLLLAALVATRYPLPSALGAALKRTAELAGLLGKFAGDVFMGTALHEALPSLLSATLGAIAGGFYFELVALIGLYLGLFNLLPLLPLDGGHLSLVAVEKLRGRPVSSETVSKMTLLVAAFAIVSMLFIAYEDLRGLLSWLSSVL